MTDESLSSWIPQHILDDMARVEKAYKELMDERTYAIYRQEKPKPKYIPGREEMEFRQKLREQNGLQD